MKFIKINSLEDSNDMFEAICQDILLAKPVDVKRNALGMTGKDSVLQAHKVTVTQLMALVARYDLMVEVKVSYDEQPVFEEKGDVLKPKDDHEGLHKDVVQAQMKKQEKEIVNPELTDIASAAVGQKKNEEVSKSVDSDKLPDPPDFF